MSIGNEQNNNDTRRERDPTVAGDILLYADAGSAGTAYTEL